MSIDSTYTDRGYLTVNVSVAGRALPIAGARVTVSRDTDNGEEVIRTMLTDASGNTERLSLPAPPARNSLSPGNTSLYAKYNVRTEYEGYYVSENVGVPVFAGRTSIQPIALQALTAGAESGAVLVNEEDEPRELEEKAEEG